MTNLKCTVCQKSKAGLTCGLCKEIICKKCTQFLDEDYFSFLKKTPEMLSYTTYCNSCHDQNILPEITKYNEMLETAKNILVFMKAQFKETRLIKRLADPIHVTECADYDETLLRLAFQAVELNYNGIIDVDIISKKIKVGKYQTTVFSGTAIPANVREDKLIKDKSNWSSPN